MRALWAFGIATALIAWRPNPAGAADFEVINTMDAGYGTLRQAILDANDNPGADRILFNISGTGVRTIQIGSALPSVTEALMIDGYTQPGASPNSIANGFNGNLLIQLDGVTRGPSGLTLQGGFSVVRGLILNRFAVAIRLNSSSNVIAGNLIGVAPNGMTAAGNMDAIVTGGDNGNVIGGPNPEDRNVIGGNERYTIQVGGQPPISAPTTNLMVLGNFLGTDASGLVPLPRNPSLTTVAILAAEDLVLGGSASGAGNVIAPGMMGISFTPSAVRSRVLGNAIGVGVDGQTPLRNTNTTSGIDAQSGVRIEGNTIAYCRAGVRVFGTRVSILANRIYSNDFGGILHANGLPVNDPLDGDLGPNEQQNYPIVSATFAETNLHLSGRLDSKAGTTYTVEFFAGAARTQNGYASAELLLDSFPLTTAGNGAALIEVDYPYPGPSLQWVTATATDPAGNTSVLAPATLIRSITVPFVHQHPVSITVTNGAVVIFTANISGALPMAYQWTKDGVELTNATNPALSVWPVQGSDRGAYRLTARNSFGMVTTDPAYLNVDVAPVFEIHPLSQSVLPGDWVTVSASVNEFTTVPMGFRWRSNNIFVATTAGTQVHSFFTYRAGGLPVNIAVVATNSVSRSGVISATATIALADDRDSDGLPDEFETRFGLDPDDSRDGNGDADGDGVTNRAEYLAGSNPRDAGSALRIVGLTAQDGTITWEFNAMSNKTYRVESSEVLTPGSWRTLLGIPARRTNSSITISDPRADPARFYRIITPYSP